MAKGKTYMIHLHNARKEHWDLRLEKNGVLKSWAVTKEPSATEKRLAVQTPDHPLSYASFEGVIPEGYGKGTVKIWDSGTYEEEKWQQGKIVVNLKGKKLKGQYVLIKPKTFEKGNWLFFKKKEE